MSMTASNLGYRQMTKRCKTPPPPCNGMGVPDINTAKHHESSDQYYGVLMQLDQRWRLIVCGKNHQLILQRREGFRGGAWRGFKYFRTKNALLQVCGRLGLLSRANEALIEGVLPPKFKNGGSRRVKI